MLFNDATAIHNEGRFKRKAIHDATRAELERRFEQKEMGDISCDDEEFERRMKADKEKGMAEYTNGDPEWKRRMNARVELGSHRRMERMRKELNPSSGSSGCIPPGQDCEAAVEEVQMRVAALEEQVAAVATVDPAASDRTWAESVNKILPRVGKDKVQLALIGKGLPMGKTRPTKKTPEEYVRSGGRLTAKDHREMNQMYRGDPTPPKRIARATKKEPVQEHCPTPPKSPQSPPWTPWQCLSHLSHLSHLATRTLDQNTLDLICTFLPTSPSCQHNQIACCNRSSNIAWRRMFYPFLRREIADIIDMMKKPGHHRLGNIDGLLRVLDIADIIGLET
jgi:hypothetical protein